MSGGGFFQGSQAGGGSPSKKQSSHTHRPVVVRQLLEAFQPHPDDDFQVDDTPLEHVTFVGNITNMATSATNCSCGVEDGTGTIDVRLWLESADDDTGKLDGLAQGVYVRVIGNLKSFNNKRSINATVIKKITDFNEIQYHLLETIYVHLYRTRGPPPVGGAMAMQGVSRNQPANTRPDHDPYAANGNNAAPSGNTYSDLKPLGRKIMLYIEKIGADNLPQEGLHLDVITRGIGSSRDVVDDEIENLLGEGMLYTTNDSEHVLPTSI